MTQKQFHVMNKSPKMPLRLSLIAEKDLTLTPINMRPLRCLSSLSSSFLPPLSRLATMISALSASDPLLSNPFSTFDVGFTPWECPDFLFPEPTSPKTVTSSTGSDYPNKTHDDKEKVEKPASDDSNRVGSIMQERKRRRMISNRESARRSRMRKQRHLENLRNQLNLFRDENRELKTQLQFLLHHCNRVRTENDWLRSERTLLCQKLFNISQFLVFQQSQPFSSAWPCITVTVE